MNTEARETDCQQSPEADTEERRGGSPAAPQEAATGKAGPFVTPSLQISGPRNWEFLAANVDTLDLGVYVDWGEAWKPLSVMLGRQKIAAQNTSGILLNDQKTLIFPSGGKRFFEWHLKRPDIDLFIRQRPDSNSTTPNVYASPSSRLLWERGPFGTQKVVARWIEELGGSIAKTKVSRMDMAADFSIPDGICSEFLKEHCVCRSQSYVFHENAAGPETAYIGAASSPIRLRIYDKTKELSRTPEKKWLQGIWGDQTYEKVVRFEFQVRRVVLRELRIDGFEDIRKVSGVWKYLTTTWFSLRYRDDENSARRTIHPLWEQVRSVATNFGKSINLTRRKIQAQPDSKRVLAQLRGNIVSFASLNGQKDFVEALEVIKDTMLKRGQDHNFYVDVQARRIRYGVPAESDEFDPHSWEGKERE